MSHSRLSTKRGIQGRKRNLPCFLWVGLGPFGWCWGWGCNEPWSWQRPPRPWSSWGVVGVVGLPPRPPPRSPGTQGGTWRLPGRWAAVQTALWAQVAEPPVQGCHQPPSLRVIWRAPPAGPLTRPPAPGPIPPVGQNLSLRPQGGYFALKATTDHFHAILVWHHALAFPSFRNTFYFGEISKFCKRNLSKKKIWKSCRTNIKRGNVRLNYGCKDRRF